MEVGLECRNSRSPGGNNKAVDQEDEGRAEAYPLKAALMSQLSSFCFEEGIRVSATIQESGLVLEIAVAKLFRRACVPRTKFNAQIRTQRGILGDGLL